MLKENKKITHKDLINVFFRSMPLEWTWNFERQQHMGYSFAIIPILKKLYGDDNKKLKEALQRHLEFFNTTPAISTMILGINIAMEENYVQNKETDTNPMRNIKAALMGPFAGIGDSIIWGTLRIIATSIGTALALEGNILGPILFLIVFNIPHYLIRYYSIISGYNMGADILKKVEKSGLMPSLSYGLAILGLMVVGAMTASLVKLNLGFNIGTIDNPILLQGVLDNIMPGILPLGITYLIYWLLGKEVSVNYILLGIVLISILGSYFGIFIL